MEKRTGDNSRAAMVFAGGMGLGAYHGGAYERFHQAKLFNLDWLAGSSVGAISAALIAGNPFERRIERLREFWSEPNVGRLVQPSAPGGLRYAQNWLTAIQTRLWGAPGHFRPRTPGLPFDDFKSFYDLGPMRRSLAQLIDFARLNSGELRVTVATTDIETGEVVVFDTLREKLTIDHLMASCGMMPEFAPVTIGGRLLGDGGLAANAPFESVLADAKNRTVFILDLFARDGGRPRSLTAAVARKNELMFGNQSMRLLEFWRDMGRGRNDRKRVLYLSYRASPVEADAEKLFDLSMETMAERWDAGAKDMEAALPEALSPVSNPLAIIRRELPHPRLDSNEASRQGV